jgi:hypothetical protein
MKVLCEITKKSVKNKFRNERTVKLNLYTKALITEEQNEINISNEWRVTDKGEESKRFDTKRETKFGKTKN